MTALIVGASRGPGSTGLVEGGPAPTLFYTNPDSGRYTDERFRDTVTGLTDTSQ